MRKYLLIFAILIIPLFAISQETILLKDGSKIQCKVTRIDSLNIYVDINKNGRNIHTYISKNEVARIVNRTEVDQKKIVPTYLPTFSNFRVKTDIGHWFGLYPNICAEYRINRYFAVNAGITYQTTGILWPEFGIEYLSSSSDKNVMNLREQWALQGTEYTIGLKYYPWDHIYASLQLSYACLSFPMEKQFSGTGDESEYDFTEEKMSRFDFGGRILIGMENKGSRRFFNEWYIGFGLKHEKINQVIYGVYYNNLLPGNYPEIINSNKIVPSIILGYNIGMKTVKYNCPNKDSCRLKSPAINSLYIGLSGINYERILLKIYPLYISGQAGTSRIMVNPLFQFSNTLFFETGFGLKYSNVFDAYYIKYGKFPFWLGNIGLRYVGYKGLFVKFGFQLLWINDNIRNIIPELGIGYSFGKKK